MPEFTQFFVDLPSGYLALAIIFLILLLCGVGLPLPEEVLLVTAGYLAFDGSISLTSAILVTFAGIMIGDSTLYWIGRRFGLAIFELRWFRRVIHRKRLRLSRQYFAQHGKRVIFYARFVAGLRAPVFLSAAILRMPFWRFFFVDFLAALISVPISVYLAYLFGDQIAAFLDWLHRTRVVVLIAVALAVVGFWLYRRFKRARA